MLVSDDNDELRILNGREPVDIGESKCYDWQSAKDNGIVRYWIYLCAVCASRGNVLYVQPHVLNVRPKDMCWMCILMRCMCILKNALYVHSQGGEVYLEMMESWMLVDWKIDWWGVTPRLLLNGSSAKWFVSEDCLAVCLDFETLGCDTLWFASFEFWGVIRVEVL